MLSSDEITPHAGEQVFIDQLSEGLRPLYRDDLPGHNFGHAHDEVLPEVIRLDGLEPTANGRGRFALIAAALCHDAGASLPADPERAEPKELRTIRLVRPILAECGFDMTDIRETNGMVWVTRAGTLCKSLGQIKIRRGDIANVGSRQRTGMLKRTVDFFREATMLAGEEGRDAPVWSEFIQAQQDVLWRLLVQDLSLGDERVIDGRGPFNRAAEGNVEWLSQDVVRDPKRFHATYDRYLSPLVGEEALASIV